MLFTGFVEFHSVLRLMGQDFLSSADRAYLWLSRVRTIEARPQDLLFNGGPLVIDLQPVASSTCEVDATARATGSIHQLLGGTG